MQVVSLNPQVECKRAQPKEVMQALQGRGRPGPYFGGISMATSTVLYIDTSSVVGESFTKILMQKT